MQNGLIQPVKLVDRDTELNINKDGSLNIQYQDSPGIDAFGRQRVAQPFGLFENKFLTGDNNTFWEYRVWGAIMVYNTLGGTASIVVGNTFTGGTSKRQGIIRSIIDGTSFTYDTSDGIIGSDNAFVVGETVTTSNGTTFIITSSNTGATYSHNYDRSSMYLTTQTVTGQRVVAQTIRYFPYYSGHSQQAVMTGTLAPKVGTTQYIMYGDDLNGVGFRSIDTTISILMRSSTTGSIVESDSKDQSQWNLDTMDGSGDKNNPSGISLDPTKSLIFWVDFQWLGVGRVRFGLDIDGKLYYVHEINHANLTSGVYMKTPSLPVRYEIINHGTPASPTNLEQICSTVNSEGGYLLPGFEYSAPPISVAAERTVTTTATPIFAIRLKNEFPTGEPNRKTLRFLDVKFSARTNEAWFELAHVHNPTYTASWSSLNESSAVEYSTDITAIDGIHIHPLQEDYIVIGVGVGGEAANISSEFISHHSFISQNYESNNSQVFVVYAKSRTGSADVWSHISWIEFG